MKDYHRLLNVSVGENRQELPPKKTVDEILHLKIKSSKAFYKEDASLLSHLEEKVKRIQRKEEAKRQRKYQWEKGMNL